MQVSSVIQFSGVYVDIQEPSGNIHKYVRLVPYEWVWLNSAYADINPNLDVKTLEGAYLASM